jgi:DNA-binding GntR family transcriptional regulator
VSTPTSDRRDARISGRRGETSLVDDVYGAVREAIMSGLYPAGSRLLLGTLARENDVSLIPVREAIRRLAAERLVEIEPNKGARVAPVSVEDMLDIYRTRSVVEAHALRLAHPHLDAATLAESEEVLREMAACFRAGDDRAALERHRVFHFSLYWPCGSAWTMHVIGLLWDAAERYLRQSAHQRPTISDFVDEHARILVAVREDGPDGAARALEAHLARTAVLLERAYVAAGAT